MCASTMQSPVDIKTNDVVTNNIIEPFDLSELTETSGIKMEMTNTGLAVNVDFPDYQPTIQGGGLPGPHKLSGFHFHWGRNSGRGSEHTINGYKFAMEAHFVFLPTNDEAKNFAAVLGVMIYAGSYNPNYEQIVSKLKDIRNNGDKVVLDNFPIMDLLPKTTGCWYRYCGSLTTPPCTETVIWTLFENSISISEHQLNEFRELMGEPDVFTEGDNYIVDNFRPVQPLLQRKVALSCPCSKRNPFRQNLRETQDYGCINHEYGFKRNHQTYSPYSSGSDICQLFEYLMRK
ncbi:carbonic anhydrase 1-like [Mytilus trossulus]|uniref:carbonic anhydrase 1-like n=1 Tax=Mytilus trossulus TaxID=6551 RepID=UPI003007F087